MQLGPNRSYIMVFVVAVMLLMLAVALSKKQFLHLGQKDQLMLPTIGETKPSKIEEHYFAP